MVPSVSRSKSTLGGPAVIRTAVAFLVFAAKEKAEPGPVFLSAQSQGPILIVLGKSVLVGAALADDILIVAASDLVALDPCFDRDGVAIGKAIGGVLTGGWVTEVASGRETHGTGLGGEGGIEPGIRAGNLVYGARGHEFASRELPMVNGLVGGDALFNRIVVCSCDSQKREHRSVESGNEMTGPHRW